jgi:hypothetical protein
MKLFVYGTKNESNELMYLIQQRSDLPPFDPSLNANMPRWTEIIPDDAKRSSATTRKCRCSKAEVLSITNIDGSDAGITSVSSSHDPEFVYKIGETVSVDNFCEDRWQECAPGIHFFITRDEAVRY